MRQTLLKTIALLLLSVGGVGFAWADGTTIYPSTAMGCRIVADGSSWKYKEDATKLATISVETYESGYRNSGFFVLEEWDFTGVDVSRIKSINITYSTKQNVGGRVWIYGSALPAATTTAADLAATMYSVMGAYPVEDKASDIEAKALANSGDRTNIATDVYQWSISISGTALSTFKSSISGNKIVLVATTSGKSKMEYYTFKNETYKPKMVIEYYPVVNTTTGVSYENLTSAVSAASSNDVITINSDITDGGITFPASKDLTIKAGTDGVTIKYTTAGTRMFTKNQSGTVTFGDPDDTKTLVLQGSADRTENLILVEMGTLNLNNVKIKDATLKDNATSKFLINQAKAGQVNMKNVTFESCSGGASATCAIVGNTRNADESATIRPLYVDGTISFTNCSGKHFYLQNALRAQDDAKLIIADDIDIYIDNTSKWFSAYNNNVLVKWSSANFGKVNVLNDNLGLEWKSGGDCKLRQAYKLTVGDAKAATLVLPFASAIPTGVSAYKLSYDTGASAAVATSVLTLEANKPVLINTEETGDFKFVSTSTSTTAVTGSGTVQEGALVGNYDEGFYAPVNSYILYKKDEKLGFYKVKNADKNKINPYRAYLTTGTLTSAPTLNIIFDGDVTGIDAVKSGTANEDSRYYNLQGQQVARPTRGLYIVNGKKVIMNK